MMSDDSGKSKKLSLSGSRLTLGGLEAGQLRATPGGAGRRTVQVEVRRKRAPAAPHRAATQKAEPVAAPPQAAPPGQLGGRAPSFDGGVGAIKEMLRPFVISDNFLPVYPRKQGEDKDVGKMARMRFMLKSIREHVGDGMSLKKLERLLAGTIFAMAE